mgnify:CR=1 FL=1
MDINLEKELFSLRNGNNEDNAETNSKNESMGYENLDPMEILRLITKKASEISEKAGQISEFQDNILEYKDEIEDLNFGTKHIFEKFKSQQDYYISYFNTKAEKVIDKFKDTKLSISLDDMKEIRKVMEISEKLTMAYNEKELKVINFFKNLRYWILGSFALLIILNIITGDLARIWYRTSVQTKQETRAELLDEIKKSGKGIYEIQHIEELERNTKIIQSWRKTAPKSSVDNFDTFMDGYFAKEK